MAFNYENLTNEVRDLMLEEFESDISANREFISNRLNSQGINQYLSIFKRSISDGNEVTFAKALGENNYFNEYETRTRNGKMIQARVPQTANIMLAEGEFNRYYMRALCLKVIRDGKGSLVVYRAKEVSNPRLESNEKIGSIVDAVELLNDLKENIGLDTSLGLPSGPNSGLSIKIKFI